MKKSEQRLSTLKTHNQHIKTTKNSYGHNFAIDMMSGMIVGFALGYSADLYFQTTPIFIFILTIIGTIAGIYNFYKGI